MTTKLLLCMLVTLTVGSLLTAQAGVDRAKRSDEIMAKARKMDLLNQILPLLLTREQLDKILPAVEKARLTAKKTEIAEYEELLKLEPGLDKSLKEAYDHGKVPAQETLSSVAKTYRTLDLARGIIANQNIDLVQAVLEKELTVGQKKTLIGSLRPQLYDSSIDPAKLTDEKRMRFFIDYVLLDFHSYEVLMELQKRLLKK